MFVVFTELIEIAVTSINLTFCLSHHPIRDKSFNRRYQLMEIFTSTEAIVWLQVYNLKTS